jgi:predicted amidophosphoribosyltransferase
VLTRNAARARLAVVLLDLLAPPLCWSCHSPAVRGEPLCRDCRRSLRFLPPAPVTLRGLKVWAPLAYDGPAADLVKALKFHAAARVAGAMAALIVANAPREGGLREGGLGEGGLREGGRGESAPREGGLREGALLDGALVPVPLHPARYRMGPFNQAALLAGAISTRTGLPLADCLRRAGPDQRQVGRGREARITGAAGSVGAVKAVPRHALLVDDVVTTGATLAACAAALRAAGAEQLRAVAFARTAGR